MMTLHHESHGHPAMSSSTVEGRNVQAEAPPCVSPHVHQGFNCHISKPKCRKLIVAGSHLCMQPRSHALFHMQYQKQVLLSCACASHACMLMWAAGHKQSPCIHPDCGPHMFFPHSKRWSNACNCSNQRQAGACSNDNWICSAGQAPVWVYLMNAAAVFAYMHLDCIDGKQARRTGSSSPLGQLFDHGTGFSAWQHFCPASWLPKDTFASGMDQMKHMHRFPGIMQWLLARSLSCCLVGNLWRGCKEASCQRELHCKWAPRQASCLQSCF